MFTKATRTIVGQIPTRNFSWKYQFRDMMNKVQNMRPKTPHDDINVFIRGLDPKKDCQLTFKDIRQDYKHFKEAYNYYMLPETEEEKRDNQ